MGRIRRCRRERLRCDGGEDERHQKNTGKPGQQTVPDGGDLFGAILHISRWTFHDLILSAKAVLPSNFSGIETCKPVSSRVNFNLLHELPPTSRTLPILPGQFAELVASDLIVTCPSFGISHDGVKRLAVLRLREADGLRRERFVGHVLLAVELAFLRRLR